MAYPGIDGRAPLVEGHRLPRLVAERGHRHRAQLALAHRRMNPGKIQLTCQQLMQRPVVQQRHRHPPPQAEQAMAEEARGLAGHARPVAAIDMFGAESLPDRGQALDRLAELQGAASQANGVDGAGGGTDDDRERIAGAVRQQVGDGGQDPDLVGRAGAAPGKDQAGERRTWGKGIGHSGASVMNCGEYSQTPRASGMPVLSACAVSDRAWLRLAGGS